MPLQRKSFTLKQKLKIIDQKLKGNLSTRQFAREVGIHEATIRLWIKSKDKLEEVERSSVPIRHLRKVPRQKIGKFPKLDEIVKEWILERNYNGIRVKDKFIRFRGIQTRDELLAQLEDGVEKDTLAKFDASKIWCFRFKRRCGFVSRRHTTTHSFPTDFRQIAMNFIKSVHEACTEFKIKTRHIINMDQVPRYYENDMSTTIALKGSKEILLRKSSTSHKRFTFTPFICGNGKFVLKHALFSKLKNVPKHHPQCRTSVSNTGMWSLLLLKTTIDEAVKNCRGLFNTKQPVLVIFDSYGVHVQFARQNKDEYMKNNVHFAIIPPRLTGLLQPLDVAVNRSFQQFFNDRSDEYQEESIRNDSNKTIRGNIKMPSCEIMTKWVIDWCQTFDQAAVQKAFKLCGLVAPEDFDANDLHQALRDVYDRSLSVEDWLAQHGTAIDTVHVNPDDDWKIFINQHSLLQAFQYLIGDTSNFKEWCSKTTKEIVNLLSTDNLTSALFSKEDAIHITQGQSLIETRLEGYALAKLFKTQIHIIDVDVDLAPTERYIFGREYPVEDVIGLFVVNGGQSVMVPPNYTTEDLTVTENIAESRDDSDGMDCDGEAMDVAEEEYLEEYLEDEDIDVNNNSVANEEQNEEILMENGFGGDGGSVSYEVEEFEVEELFEENIIEEVAVEELISDNENLSQYEVEPQSSDEELIIVV